MGLGAGAGAVGAAIDWAGGAAGLVRTGAVVSGLLVVLVGLFWIVPGLSDRALRLTRPLWGRLGIESWLGRRALGHGLVQLKRRRTTVRAGLLGLLTPALPCGYLYAFVLSAAGTGSALGGALLMFAFWLGTLPVLVVVGQAVTRLSRTLWVRLPVVTGLLFVTIGVLGVLGHALAQAPHPGGTPAEALQAISRGQTHEHAACH
jgi:sulfite exporter TauE/SafE